jgi:cyclopropane-fatty-acyl-phospholipid synthase
MNRDDFHRKIEFLLALADVKIEGDRPWDIHVYNDRFYTRVLAEGSLGLGEAYVDGWWNCERLDEFFCKILTAELESRVRSWTLFRDSLKARLLNLQTPSRAYRSGQFHYDIGNDLYQNMLDGRLIYTAGYWRDASSLDEAQENKLELIGRKLHLQPGMRVLDIGCGWGGTAKFLAERYNVEVVGITVAREQARLGKELCMGLPVEIRLEDYRSLHETFDRILSLGMFEHVGYKNYSTFMRIVRKCLKDDGIFVLRTIGGNQPVTTTDPWIARYIFPNGMLPSPSQIGTAIEGIFVLEGWENFGPDYDKTLMHWFKTFHENWERISDKYGERFYRIWKYYLLACAGAFRARKNQLWEIILSPQGVPNGYRDIADASYCGIGSDQAK